MNEKIIPPDNHYNEAKRLSELYSDSVVRIYHVKDNLFFIRFDPEPRTEIDGDPVTLILSFKDGVEQP